MAYLEQDGSRLFFEVSGDPQAPPLVFSNSVASNSTMWDRQVNALASYFRILRYDNRGHGRSGEFPAPYSLSTLAEDALAVMDHAGIKKAHWCGLSLGGIVGQWLLINRPERLDRAILANTTAYWPAPSIWPGRIAAAIEHGMAPIATPTLERWFTPQFRQSHPAEVRRIENAILGTSIQGYAGACAALQDIDFRPSLGGVSNPLLLISGKYDPSTTTILMQEISDRTGARLVELDCAHLSNIEADEAFTAEVKKFLLAFRERV